MENILEELLVYALLLGEDIVSEEEYQHRLDSLFIENPTDDILLELEFMSSDIRESIIHIRTHVDYSNLNYAAFGTILMQKLKEHYENTELKRFAEMAYALWESLPGNIQDKEPFWTLCYADDPLSWGDEMQTREIYEHMLNYYDSGE